MQTISEEKLEEARAMSKFVTFNYKKLTEMGLVEVIAKYYAEEEASTTAGEPKDPELEAKIAQIQKTLDGNDYGCQEERTRAIFGLMLCGDDKVFKKTATTSSDGITFPTVQERYSFLCLTPLRNPNSHDYPIGRASMCSSRARGHLIRDRVTSVGNDMCSRSSSRTTYYQNAEEIANTPEGETAERNIRLSTEEEIDRFFDTMKLILEETTSTGNVYKVSDYFPLMTGHVGRTLRRFLPQLENYTLPADEVATPEGEATEGVS